MLIKKCSFCTKHTGVYHSPCRPNTIRKEILEQFSKPHFLRSMKIAPFSSLLRNRKENLTIFELCKKVWLWSLKVILKFLSLYLVSPNLWFSKCFKFHHATLQATYKDDKKKITLIGPYLIKIQIPSKSNLFFLLVTGRQVVSAANSAESARMACQYISWGSLLTRGKKILEQLSRTPFLTSYKKFRLFIPCSTLQRRKGREFQIP